MLNLSPSQTFPIEQEGDSQATVVLDVTKVKKATVLPLHKFHEVDFQETEEQIEATTSLPNKHNSDTATILLKTVKTNVPNAPIAVLQNWEGYVETIGDTSFTARLLDKTDGEEALEEIAEIPFSEIDSNDHDLLRVGAIFFLSVFRQLQSNGRTAVTTRMIFRRLPMWHERTLTAAKATADSMADYFANPDDAS